MQILFQPSRTNSKSKKKKRKGKFERKIRGEFACCINRDSRQDTPIQRQSDGIRFRFVGSLASWIIGHHRRSLSSPSSSIHRPCNLVGTIEEVQQQRAHPGA